MRPVRPAPATTDVTLADLAAALYSVEELVLACRRNIALLPGYKGARQNTIDCAERATAILTRVADILRRA